MKPIPSRKSKYKVPKATEARTCLTDGMTPSFINHYIFPGGYLPSITQLLNHISRESRGTLIVEKVENIGGHYARTLRLWKENFMAQFESKIAPALKKHHPGMGRDEVAVFRRKWEVSIRNQDIRPGCRRRLTMEKKY
jgi:cyclopropane fatty-acyl-phospholipid synthase-like methyltransferase